MEKEPPPHILLLHTASDRLTENTNHEFLIVAEKLVRVEESGFRECLDGVTGYGWHEITRRGHRTAATRAMMMIMMVVGVGC